MGFPRWLLIIGILALAPGMVACGDDESSPPTAEQLAARLITADSFDGVWTIDPGPPDGGDMTSGVVPEDQRDLLPRIESCDAASPESQAAVDSLTWMAFRQMNLAVDNPIEPPDDRTGHLVFVQQALTSGDPDELAATFDLVRAGAEACFGAIPASEEGPGRAEAMPVPEVGDERFGVLTIIEEAGGWAEWRVHNAFVLDSDALMSITVVEIRAGEGIEPYYSIDQVGQMIAIAADTP